MTVDADPCFVIEMNAGREDQHHQATLVLARLCQSAGFLFQKRPQILQGSGPI
jgi:hypothetical protein